VSDIIWTLTLTCDNCHANIELGSRLGEGRPLKTDGKRAKLLKQAQEYCRIPREEPPTPEIAALVQRTFTTIGKDSKCVVVPYPTKYVRCPVCTNKIFVC